MERGRRRPFCILTNGVNAICSPEGQQLFRQNLSRFVASLDQSPVAAQETGRGERSSLICSHLAVPGILTDHSGEVPALSGLLQVTKSWGLP